ncbi:MAG: radical SAM protein [Streptococcus sp.]|nr:radical SAM protein [Streptococcus sp.]
MENLSSQSPSKYTDLRKLPRVSLVDAVPLPAPFTIYIEPTNVCNFKCLYCPESFSDFKERSGGFFNLKMNDFLNIANQIEDFGGVKAINFYMMGEPFANPYLCEFIKISKDRNLANNLTVTSNGSLIKEKYFEPLLNSGLDYLRISIYGGNETQHTIRTQSKYHLSTIHKNVTDFKKYRDSFKKTYPYIYVKMIDSMDAQENEQFRHLFSDASDEVFIEPVMNWNDPSDGNLALRPIEDLLASEYFSNRKHVCPFPFYTLIIHADMQVSVCCVDWEKNAVVGNLRFESLNDIWMGEKMHQFRMIHLERNRKIIQACQNCTYIFTAPDNIDALTPELFQKRYLVLKT